MQTYEIKQFEIHVFTYRVEAESEAEAVTKLFDGSAQPMDDESEYVQIAEELGLPVDKFQNLAEELEARGITVGEAIIPSIASIRMVTNNETATK